MNEQQAIEKMIPPGKRRHKKRMGGVIQVWVTRNCDKCCFNCTQGSNLRGTSGYISPEQFEQAVVTLKDYYGIVGVFGGNPCIHPKFGELCEILKKHIPFKRRGLWANKPFGKAKLCRGVFNPQYSNLNVHLDAAAYREWKKDWPESLPFGLRQDSRHPPVYVALKDVIENEEERWDLIADCDINKYWSAMIGVFRGELRAWFCEIAGAQSILHQNDPEYPDTGVAVVEGWWRGPMSKFAHQARLHCHDCGVPLRGYGELSQAPEGVEQVSATHAGVYQSKKKDRPIEVVTKRDEILEQSVERLTNYYQNGKK